MDKSFVSSIQTKFLHGYGGGHKDFPLAENPLSIDVTDRGRYIFFKNVDPYSSEGPISSNTGATQTGHYG